MKNHLKLAWHSGVIFCSLIFSWSLISLIARGLGHDLGFVEFSLGVSGMAVFTVLSYLPILRLLDYLLLRSTPWSTIQGKVIDKHLTASGFELELRIVAEHVPLQIVRVAISPDVMDRVVPDLDVNVSYKERPLRGGLIYGGVSLKSSDDLVTRKVIYSGFISPPGGPVIPFDFESPVDSTLSDLNSAAFDALAKAMQLHGGEVNYLPIGAVGADSDGFSG